MLNKLCVISIALALGLSPAAHGDENALLEKSRAITAEYASQLQAALQDALKSGGPVAAIQVCSEIAPRVAADLSRHSGARVRRTSLKYRNPGNAPDAWESSALERLESTDTREIFETDDSGGARYAKAIPTGAVCLACHGEKLAPEIQAEIDATYPHDRARGFEIGDLRGAFSIYWPPEP